MKTLKKDYRSASRRDADIQGLFLLFSCISSSMTLLRLLEYLQAMRNYFLLEAGDTMYDFYTAIFDKMQEKESWQQLSFLNIQLQEAVGQRHPEDSSRYCIYFVSKKKVRTMAIK